MSKVKTGKIMTVKPRFIIKEESRIDSVGIYDLHKLAKITDKQVPKMVSIISSNVKRTHFLGWGVRSKNIPI